MTRPHQAPLKPRPLARPRPLRPRRAPPPAARPSVEAPARPRPAARPRPSAPATPPGCHDNGSAPRAPLLLGRDPGWTAGPGLGATAATAAFVSSPSPSRPASPRLTRARGRGPSPPPLPARMPKVKALQCALALEIRSVSTGDLSPGARSLHRSTPRTPSHPKPPSLSESSLGSLDLWPPPSSHLKPLSALPLLSHSLAPLSTPCFIPISTCSFFQSFQLFFPHSPLRQLNFPVSCLGGRLLFFCSCSRECYWPSLLPSFLGVVRRVGG